MCGFGEFLFSGFDLVFLVFYMVFCWSGLVLPAWDVVDLVVGVFWVYGCG